MSIVFDLRPEIKLHRGKELFYKTQETVMLKDVGWVAVESADSQTYA